MIFYWSGKKKKNKTFDVGCIIKWDLKINKVVFWVYERPQNLGALKKEIWVLVRAPLFWGSGVELPLIFYTKKKEKKNTNYMIKILHCHWLNKNKYNHGKLKLTKLWVLVTIYAKEYKAFCPSYNLPNLKRKQNPSLPIQKI